MTDLADVIERTRRVKRRLYMGPLQIRSDTVFKGDFLDVDALEELLDVVNDQGLTDPPDEKLQCANQLQNIIESLKCNPPRPSDESLCERFTSGDIDARTVIHITKWSPIELYDACTKYGFEVPDIRS